MGGYSTVRVLFRTAFAVCLALSLSSCADRRAPDGKPKLPFGGVNTPVGQQRISGKVSVTGWALSEAGIESVSVYVDRDFVADCSTGIRRPDVAAAYPKMPGNEESGWTAEVQSAAFSPGWHELTVQARSKEGSARDLASIAVLVER